jgi:hypothetical protein
MLLPAPVAITTEPSTRVEVTTCFAISGITHAQLVR